jgi:hypothetical protein
MRDDGSAAERLHHHLVRLGELVRAHPQAFAVLAELDVRARRDGLMRASIQRDEQGWRAALAAVFADGVEEGAWADAVDPRAAVELVVTTVKGIRIAPEHAGAVLRQLALRR